VDSGGEEEDNQGEDTMFTLGDDLFGVDCDDLISGSRLGRAADCVASLMVGGEGWEYVIHFDSWSAESL
jgi:hypothetical protein